MFEVTERCLTAYPGAAAGVLVMRNVLLFAPKAETELLRVYSASGGLSD